MQSKKNARLSSFTKKDVSSVPASKAKRQWRDDVKSIPRKTKPDVYFKLAIIGSFVNSSNRKITKKALSSLKWNKEEDVNCASREIKLKFNNTTRT